MSDIQYVFNGLDKFTQEQIRFTALSPQFKHLLKAVQEDCKMKFAKLDYTNSAQLQAEYQRLAIRCEVYADLLDLLTKITTENGEIQ